MTLPELPKGKNRKESKIDSLVIDWFYKHWPRSTVIEVKVVGGKVLEHQRRLLKKVAETGKFKYKHPDMGQRTPGDGFTIKDGDAVLCWCEGRNCVCEINGTSKIEIKV
jgi:hypothetical protein